MTTAKVTTGLAPDGAVSASPSAPRAAARTAATTAATAAATTAARPASAVKPGQAGSARQGQGAATLTRRQQVIYRTLAGVVGGYAFCWGLGAFSMALLFTIGMGFHDAEHLLAIVTFLVYPCLFMWAFFAPDLKRLAIVLLGGGGLMAAAATLLQWRLV